jgi:CDP-paratose 2-epimerase
MRLLVTGGCGFVGSRMCLGIRAVDPSAEVVAFDNLRRRGSETNLISLGAAGVDVVHGDIRLPADLDDLDGTFDVVFDAAAEPSVHAGTTGSPRYVIDTNLGGTVNLLEFARRRAKTFVLLSTSRVYSIEALRGIETTEGDTRYEVTPAQQLPGVGPQGITEEFPTDGARSYYGASKLASEMLAQEYAAASDLEVIINRCGVLAGAGQFGKVDQGVMALWVAAHIYGRPLKYIGFGGTGKQVRDLMHPDDLLALVMRQLEMAGDISGQVFNVGGGLPISVSLLELTDLCRERTSNEVPITPVPETASVDVPVYLTDTSRVREVTGWSPSWDASAIIDDIATWIEGDIERLRPIFT